MSKQSEAKEAQGYTRETASCSNCQHFRFEQVVKQYQGYSGLQTWSEDKNLRCGIGGFKVQKTAVCDLFERKD